MAPWIPSLGSLCRSRHPKEGKRNHHHPENDSSTHDMSCSGPIDIFSGDCSAEEIRLALAKPGSHHQKGYAVSLNSRSSSTKHHSHGHSSSNHHHSHTARSPPRPQRKQQPAHLYSSLESIERAVLEDETRVRNDALQDKVLQDLPQLRVRSSVNFVSDLTTDLEYHENFDSLVEDVAAAQEEEETDHPPETTTTTRPRLYPKLYESERVLEVSDEDDDDSRSEDQPPPPPPLQQDSPPPSRNMRTAPRPLYNDSFTTLDNSVL